MILSWPLPACLGVKSWHHIIRCPGVQTNNILGDGRCRPSSSVSSVQPLSHLCSSLAASTPGRGHQPASGLISSPDNRIEPGVGSGNYNRRGSQWNWWIICFGSALWVREKNKKTNLKGRHLPFFVFQTLCIIFRCPMSFYTRTICHVPSSFLGRLNIIITLSVAERKPSECFH